MPDIKINLTFYPSYSTEYSKRFLDIRQAAESIKRAGMSVKFNDSRSLHIDVGNTRCIIFASGFAEIHGHSSNGEELKECSRILVENVPGQYFGELRAVIRDIGNLNKDVPRLNALLKDISASCKMEGNVGMSDNDLLFSARAL